MNALMSDFQKLIKKYFYFNSAQQTGIIGIIILIILIYQLPDILYNQNEYPVEIINFQKEIAMMDSESDKKPYQPYHKYNPQKPESFEPFDFDPNTVNPNELKKFGLPKYVIERFSKFRNAGAKFYKKEDFKKLYGLKPDIYNRMAPYIRIENQSQNNGFLNKQIRTAEITKPTIVMIELNSADSSDLLGVHGIGPYMASKIIKYRKALGGFVRIDQLYEIYNMKPEQVEAIKPFINVDPKNIQPIPVNTADYLQLNGNPYISSKEANAIIQYRKQHGAFKSIDDLEKIYLLNKETIEKIVEYLVY